MPTYTYECEAGHIVEHMSSMNDAPLTKCLTKGCRKACSRVILAPPRVAWGPERVILRGRDRDPPTKVFMKDGRKKRAK